MSASYSWNHFRSLLKPDKTTGVTRNTDWRPSSCFEGFTAIGPCNAVKKTAKRCLHVVLKLVMLKDYQQLQLRYTQLLASEPTGNCLLFPDELPSPKHMLGTASPSSWSPLLKFQSISLIWPTYPRLVNSAKTPLFPKEKETDNISITTLCSFQESLKALHIPRPLNNNLNTNTRRQVQTGRICKSLIIRHRYWEAGKLFTNPKYWEAFKIEFQPARPSK